MKRRRVRERDEASAREEAERRTEKLLAQLKGQEAAARRHPKQDAPASGTEPDNPEPSPTKPSPTEPSATENKPS
jgi:hypothetical protein